MQRGYALVTGASNGIGRAMAIELAKHGFGIVGVARSADKLDKAMQECGTHNGGRVRALPADLSEPGAVDRIIGSIGSLELDAVVNCAGYAVWGRFAQLPLEEQLGMFRVNVQVPMELTHPLLPRLLQRPRGYVLNMSSATAYSAVATLGVYAAGKSFLLRWSRALRLELAGTNVTVTCICPGSVTTGFTERAGMQAMDELAQRFGKPPAAIAGVAVKAMLTGRAEVVPGALDKLTALLMRIMPATLTERVASGIYLKRLPSH